MYKPAVPVSRSLRPFQSLLAAVMLAAALPAAAQTPDPAAQPSGNATSPAPQGGASATAAAPASSATPASGSSASPNAAGKKGAAKDAAVCFQLTGNCVPAAKAKAHQPAASSGSSATGNGTPAATTTSKPLNLKAPDVSRVVPASELKEPLPTDQQITETQESETVQVRGESAPPPPDVPGGFGAIWWALSHPSQSWRIVAPAE